MTLNTIFNLASLTKVVATTTAVMQLVENGRIRLADKVSAYVPGIRALRQGWRHNPAPAHAHVRLRPKLRICAEFSNFEGEGEAIRRAIEEVPVPHLANDSSIPTSTSCCCTMLVGAVSGERFNASAGRVSRRSA